MIHGLKDSRKFGMEAMPKEIINLNDRNVLDSNKPNTPTCENRVVALAYLFFPKNKRDGMIKGHGCCDRKKQRIYMTKEDTGYPTVSLEALILPCVIDATERRDVYISDIPGEFMHIDMECTFQIDLWRAMEYMLINTEPVKYAIKIVIEGEKEVIYAVILKALYRTLFAIFLF